MILLCFPRRPCLSSSSATQDLWQTSLWRVPVDGGEETRILESVMGGAFDLGRKGVYFVAPRTSGTSAVQFLSFATGKVTTIALIHRPVDFGLSVSPDERFILYTQLDPTGQQPDAGGKFPVIRAYIDADIPILKQAKAEYAKLE